MKRCIPILFVLLASHLSAKEVTETETIEKELAVEDPSSDFTIVVDNVFGSVAIKGSAGKTVRAHIRKSIWARSPEQFDQAKADVALEILQETDLIEFYVDGPFRDDGKHNSSWNTNRYTVTYDFKIDMPRDMSIDIRTVNDGDIIVEEFGGPYQVHNVNGGIRMDGLRGSGDAVTVNGDISCRFDENPESDCDFKSINGDIRLYFSGPLSADVAFETLNGEMFSDFSVSRVPESRFVQVKKNGKTFYKAKRPMKVRLGGGGPLLSASGINGNLYVLKVR